MTDQIYAAFTITGIRKSGPVKQVDYEIRSFGRVSAEFLAVMEEAFLDGRPVNIAVYKRP